MGAIIRQSKTIAPSNKDSLNEAQNEQNNEAIPYTLSFIPLIYMLILRGADVNAPIYGNNIHFPITPLRQAIICQNALLVGQLLNWNAQPSSDDLIFAAEEDYTKIAGLLLGNMNKEKINGHTSTSDSVPYTALIAAIDKFHAEIVELLINKGATVTEKEWLRAYRILYRIIKELNPPLGYHLTTPSLTNDLFGRLLGFGNQIADLELDATPRAKYLAPNCQRHIDPYPKEMLKKYQNICKIIRLLDKEIRTAGTINLNPGIDLRRYDGHGL